MPINLEYRQYSKTRKGEWCVNGANHLEVYCPCGAHYVPRSDSGLRDDWMVDCVACGQKLICIGLEQPSLNTDP